MYKLAFDLDAHTYTASSVKDDPKNHWDFVFTRQPTGSVFLVQIIGRTGDSEGSNDTTWEVEVFQDREQAEFLADRIDFTYDLSEAIKNRNFPNPGRFKHAPEGRAEAIAEIMFLYEAMPDLEKGNYQRSHVDRIEYLFEQEKLATYPSWQGHFDSMYLVQVVELTREVPRKRWRDRRNS